MVIEGVLPYPSNPNKPYTCNTTDKAHVISLRSLRAAYQLFLDQTESVVANNVYCQAVSGDLDAMPRVIQVVHETDEMYDGRVGAAKLAKVNTLKERLAQHDAAAAAIRAELEKTE